LLARAARASRLGRDGKRRRRDETIVAKHLTASHVFLPLYFTIFLNQLDNL
jgi:hypothetical protein